MFRSRQSKSEVWVRTKNAFPPDRGVPVLNQWRATETPDAEWRSPLAPCGGRNQCSDAARRNLSRPPHLPQTCRSYSKTSASSPAGTRTHAQNRGPALEPYALSPGPKAVKQLAKHRSKNHGGMHVETRPGAGPKPANRHPATPAQQGCRRNTPHAVPEKPPGRKRAKLNYMQK